MFQKDAGRMDTSRPVTIWRHPNWDSSLIITGDDAPFIEHRDLAKGYLGDADCPNLLMRLGGSRTRAELEKLREWDG